MLEFTIKTSAEAEKFVAGVDKKLDNPNVMLTKIGTYQLSSLHKNFAVGGRPEKWADLSPLTKALRRGGPPYEIMKDTRRLEGSLNFRVTGKQVGVGTNLAKAALLHFGGMTKGGEVTLEDKGGLSSPWGLSSGKRTFHIGPKPVPSRKFVMFQNEDIIAIEKLGLKHIEDATK